MEISKPGKYHAVIYARGFFLAPNTQSVAIAIGCMCTHRMNEETGAFDSFPTPWPEVEGNVWIVGADGKPKWTAQERFSLATGWNGTVEQITDPEWKPNTVEIEVDWDEYKGKRTLKIQWVNPLEKIKGVRPTSPPVLDEIKARLQRAKDGTYIKQPEQADPPSATTGPDPDAALGIPF